MAKEITFNDAGEVGSYASKQLDNGLVETCSNTSLTENWLTEMGVANTKWKLLLFGRFSWGQVGR